MAPQQRPGDSRDKRASESSDRRKSHHSEKRRSHAGGSPEKDRRRSRASASPEKEARRSHSRTSPDKHREKAILTDAYADTQSSSTLLSAHSLARLDAINEKLAPGAVEAERAGRSRERLVKEKPVGKKEHRHRKGEGAGVEREKHRVISGTHLEAAREHRRNIFKPDTKKKKVLCLLAVLVMLLLVVLIPVGVLVIGKNNGGDKDSLSMNSSSSGVDASTVPAWAKGTYFDPSRWYDTSDFNITVTNDTVGGLPIMGLNSTWDDSAQANPNVPKLNDKFAYGTMPIRGVNLGGWLNLEPFITPSMFQYPSAQGIVDEYTLCKMLGPAKAASMLEKHYATFINAAEFDAVRDAGFDHVRIPYSYWAVATYDGDPYVPKISWRYLLRGIEYARQRGLRVNLDLHALPGSQNGWNHSGRLGAIGWLNGTDGALNGQRALDIHRQLSTFFAQARYRNVVGIYGLVNEPKMISLPLAPVLNWTTSAIDIIRQSGITQTIAFGDGFLGLPNWQGKLAGIKGLVLDAHQYIIFNVDQVGFDHQTKLNFACTGWAGQMRMSMNTATGFGPTLCGEWSQADTDCATYLNNVNVGSRWTGTLNIGDPSGNVLVPACPLKTASCSCERANADPSAYSDQYRHWLRANAEGSMVAFETGWGWFYWTWLTETNVQWSWRLGMRAGILPPKVWERDYNCSVPSRDWAKEGLEENY